MNLKRYKRHIIMIRIDQNITQKIEKFFSWNGCDDKLKKRIEKSIFVRNIRNQLAKKSLFTKSKFVQKKQS